MDASEKTLNAWISPQVARLNRPDWMLADAIHARFGLQTAFSRYVPEGTNYYRYDLYVVMASSDLDEARDDSKLALIDKIQTFIAGFRDGVGDDAGGRELVER